MEIMTVILIENIVEYCAHVEFYTSFSVKLMKNIYHTSKHVH